MRIAFVCLGNICRSPLAEALFVHHLEKKGISGRYHVDSFGTGAWHVGERADSRTRKNAAGHGIEIPHRAQQIKAPDFANFDLLVAMSAANKAGMERIMPKGWEGRIELMRAYDSAVEGSGEVPDVPDPYYEAGDGFEEVFQIVDRSTLQLLEKLEADR